jgi:plastocyanin
MSFPFSFPRATALALALALAGAALPEAAGSVQVTVKDNKGAPVADAVVSLVPLDAPAAVTPPAEPIVISQHDQEFEPYVTALVAGSHVAFPNRDTVRHQVYSLSKTKPFDIPLYGPGASETVLFDRPGIVALGCNIHDWMSAYIVVLGTPFFLKTPADGAVAFPVLPPGRYRLDVWHPRLANETRREVVVAPGDSPVQSISVVLKPDRRIRRAPDGDGGGYK